MNAEDLTLIQSLAAQQIAADYYDLASHAGITLEYVSWGRDVAHTCMPFHLAIKVSGMSYIREIAFTQEQIEGYITGKSRAEIQDRLRADLEDVLINADC
jgi:hypothetical protein